MGEAPRNVPCDSKSPSFRALSGVQALRLSRFQVSLSETAFPSNSASSGRFLSLVYSGRQVILSRRYRHSCQYYLNAVV